jgi:hypothetical protein
MIDNGFSVWFLIVSPVTSSSITKSVPEPYLDSYATLLIQVVVC